jgi:hypothetical protein
MNELEDEHEAGQLLPACSQFFPAEEMPFV